MAFTDNPNVVILNDGEYYSAKFAERTGGKKARRTIEVRSEPLLFDFDEVALGAKPAEAIREVLRAGIKGIMQVASRATLERRERAKKRLTGGLTDRQDAFRRRGTHYSGAYEKRYSGGRMGLMVPGQTVRVFNDSGRLAEGLAVRQNPEDKTFTINIPINRLDPSEFKPGRFEIMLNRLRALVPELADARRLMNHPKVREAIDLSISDMIMKAEMKQRSLLLARAAKRRQAVMQLLRTLAATG